ncbi:hypothetical protein CgunFtcFv8_001322 [Champsocephalus gunnari]|uniref:XK-related protein n=1 Tax=Champsocephalus gunnari TaxID=52237 RepID=A0AAN8HUA8_CHAGU|nr:hypothetical protein CgunFtcFv8_001322 [Champsocephalus gunnari]
MAAKSDGAAAAAAAAAPPPPRCSLADCCWTLCALLVFFSDGASDLWLCADYYLRGEYWCFALTLVFVIVPSLVVQALSFRWFAYDFCESGDAAAAEAVVAATSGGGGAAEEKGDFSTKDSDVSTKDSDEERRRGGGRGGATGTGAVLPGPGTGGSARGCCRACAWFLQAVIHTLQLAQVWRYVHALYLGVQSRWHTDPERRHYYWRMMFASADISMLRLLESFLKSAPQLVLQLSFIIQAGDVLPLQGLSASASLVSLSWMVASYQKVLRDSRDDKLPMSYKAVLVQILWHLFTIGARALAFALFASAFPLYFGVFVVAHWCVMTFWIIQGETDFCMSKWEEIIYNMMVGIVYIFCWFSVREGRTRCRLLIYSLTVLLENAFLTAAWYLHRGPSSSESYAVAMVCVVSSSYALGSFFMCVYYCLLHPDGPVWGWRPVVEKEDLPVELLASPAVSLPPDVVSSPPRTLQRTKGPDYSGVDGDVFQICPGRSTPAWDAHFIDRRLRKTILVLESAAPVTPRIQYRCLATPKEVMEYETTV